MTEYILKLIPYVLLLSLTLSCSEEETPATLPQVEVVESEKPAQGENTEEQQGKEPAGRVIFLERDRVDNSFLLVNDALKNRVFLMDRNAEIKHEWNFKTGLGNDCLLLQNGQLLSLLEAESPFIKFGGFGGKLQLINPDNSIAWEYKISSENSISHHDVEMLPNGNVIILVWVKKSGSEAQEAGFKFNYDIYPESVYELNPETMEIVWQWDSWDHLIQDFDKTKKNYGEISQNPQKIDINFNPNASGDIMHANGIAYDEKNDLIYLSINFYSEIWVIDHSTTAEEVKGSAGGNYNRGGDLVYRFGNPSAYKNTASERLFFNNHYPNLTVNTANNTMFVFSNGNTLGQSTVYEFELPEQYDLKPNTKNEPAIIWTYTHPDLYSQKVSGAEELSNGNILITEGDFGAWEVSRSGEVVWQFEGEGFYWRIYPYDPGDPALSGFKLD